MSLSKKKRGISFSLLTAGIVFLFNPLFQMFDLLPDTLGYLFLILALRPLRDEVAGFSAATEELSRMLFISLSRLAAIFITAAVRAEDAGERSITAVVLFVYLLIEVYFGTRAFRALFSAFFGLSERYGVRSAGVVVKNGRSTSADFLPMLTTIFLAVRGLCALIPEALFLHVEDTSLSGEKVFLASGLYLPVLLLSLLVGIVFGILWLTSLLTYFRGVRNDPDLSAATAIAAAVRPSEYRRCVAAYRRDRLAVGLLTVATLFTADIYIDGIDVLPDFVSPVLLGLALFLLVPTLGKKPLRLPIAATALQLLATVTDFVLVSRFLVLYDPSDLHRVRDADALYRICRVAECVKGVTTVFFAVTLAYVVYMLLHQAASRTAVSSSHTWAGTEKKYRSRFRILAILGSIEVFFGVADFFLKDLTETVEASEAILGTGTVVIEIYGWFWLLAAAVSLLYFGYTYFLLTDITEELHYAYGIDD